MTSENRAVLIDLDGVLGCWSSLHEESIEREEKLPLGMLRRIAFAPDLLQAAITGRVSDEAWRVSIGERLQAQFPGCTAAASVHRWSEPVGKVDMEVLKLLRESPMRLRACSPI